MITVDVIKPCWESDNTVFCIDRLCKIVSKLIGRCDKQINFKFNTLIHRWQFFSFNAKSHHRVHLFTFPETGRLAPQHGSRYSHGVSGSHPQRAILRHEYDNCEARPSCNWSVCAQRHTRRHLIKRGLLNLVGDERVWDIGGSPEWHLEMASRRIAAPGLMVTNGHDVNWEFTRCVFMEVFSLSAPYRIIDEALLVNTASTESFAYVTLGCLHSVSQNVGRHLYSKFFKRKWFQQKLFISSNLLHAFYHVVKFYTGAGQKIKAHLIRAKCS